MLAPLSPQIQMHERVVELTHVLDRVEDAADVPVAFSE